MTPGEITRLEKALRELREERARDWASFREHEFGRPPSQGFFDRCPVYTFDRLGSPERCDQPVVDMGCRCDDLRWEAPAP